jgi:murein DD-endopeptidase MepM/ murein hydrolase activator NlpD
MNDLSISNYLTDSLTSNLSSNRIANKIQAETTSFQQLFSYMLLSTLNSALNSDTDQNDDIGSMLPSLFSILDQFQSQQLSTQFQSSIQGSTTEPQMLPSTAFASFYVENPVQAKLNYLKYGIQAADLPIQAKVDYSQYGIQSSDLPVQGRLTQGYTSTHHGLDFGVVVGTPVRSTIEGTVAFAGWSEAGYGNLVIVENGPYKTYYGHLSDIPVTVGQTVQKGEVIGLSGNTGKSSGPHVHYEIRRNHVQIDPNTFDPTNLTIKE